MDGIGERAHIPIGKARHLAVSHPKWAGGDFGETIYVYTPRIMGIIGNDSMGSKIDRKGLVEAGVGIPLGEMGRLGNNIHSPAVANDERTQRTACVCQPD